MNVPDADATPRVDLACGPALGPAEFGDELKDVLAGGHTNSTAPRAALIRLLSGAFMTRADSSCSYA